MGYNCLKIYDKKNNTFIMYAFCCINGVCTIIHS